MSSTMSTLRMPNHTLSPSTNPTRPTRMSTTPKICANRLSTISHGPPRVLHRCLVAKYTSWATWWMRLFLAFIHPSVWKVNSQKFALLAWECGGFVARVSWARVKGLARWVGPLAEAGGRSMHRVRRARDEPREPRLLWTGLRLSRGSDEGRAREGALHRSDLRWDGG